MSLEFTGADGQTRRYYANELPHAVLTLDETGHSRSVEELFAERGIPVDIVRQPTDSDPAEQGPALHLTWPARNEGDGERYRTYYGASQIGFYYLSHFVEIKAVAE